MCTQRKLIFTVSCFCLKVTVVPRPLGRFLFLADNPGTKLPRVAGIIFPARPARTRQFPMWVHRTAAEADSERVIDDMAEEIRLVV